MKGHGGTSSTRRMPEGKENESCRVREIVIEKNRLGVAKSQARNHTVSSRQKKYVASWPTTLRSAFQGEKKSTRREGDHCRTVPNGLECVGRGPGAICTNAARSPTLQDELVVT